MVNLALLDFKAQRYSECFTWCERALKYALPGHLAWLLTIPMHFCAFSGCLP